MTRQRVPRPNEGPGLRPAARPVDTYTRPFREAAPAAPVQNTGMAQIAQALSNFEPALRQFTADRRVEHEEDMRSQAEQRINGLSFEEAQRLRESGELAAIDDPYYLDALNQFYGQRLAQHRYNDLAQRLEGVSTSGDPSNPNHFDRIGGDFDAWFQENIRVDQETLQGSSANGAYLESMATVRDRLTGRYSEMRAEEAQERSADVAAQTFMGYSQEGLKEGSTVPEIGDRIRQSYSELRDRFGMTNQQIDDVLVTVAASLAEQGQYELVQELLMSERDGIPAIGAKASMMPTVSRIMEVARDRQLENLKSGQLPALVHFGDAAQQGLLDETQLQAYRTSFPGVVSDSQAQSWIEQSRAASRRAEAKLAEMEVERQQMIASQESEAALTEHLMSAADAGHLQFLDTSFTLKENGEEQEWSADQQRDRWANSYVEEFSPAIAQQRGETPQETFLRELEVFSINGVEHPTWGNIIQAGPAAASLATVTGDEIPPTLQAGFEMYMQLHTANPRYLDSIMSDSTAVQFYEAARIGRTYIGLDDQQAILAATQVTRDLDGDQTPSQKARYQLLAQELEAVQNSGENWFGFGDTVQNMGAVGRDLERVARMHVAMGLAPKKALELARDQIIDTHSVVHGYMINTSGVRIQTIPQTLQSIGFEPTGFETIAEGYIEDYATTLDGVDKDDLTLMPLSNTDGAFMVVGRENWSSVFAAMAEGRLPTVSLDQLVKWERNRQRDVRRELTGEIIQGQENTILGEISQEELAEAERFLADPKAMERLQSGRMISEYSPIQYGYQVDLSTIQAVMEHRNIRMDDNP